MDWKKIGKKLLFPPIWVLVILVVVTAVTVPYVLINDLSQSPIAYAVYVVAFYTVCTVSVFFAMVLPKQYKQIRQKIFDNPLGNRYMTDAAFRTRISLYTSLGVNLLYVAVNIISYFLYRSMWFVCLAVYYSILAVMRFLLVRYVRVNKIGDNRRGELKRSVLCSVILLTLNFFLSGAVLMIVYQNKGFQYHGVLIYVMAAYTFYITTHAIIDLFKYRRYHSPVMTTAKIITLSAALVSMLSLETAMFAQFGAEMARNDQRLMIMLTGAGVSITVIIMSVYMILRSTKEMKEMRNNGNGKQG